MTTAKTLASDYMPYASGRSVIQVITRYREHGLPELLTTESLQLVGITASTASFTVRALLFLGLVEDTGAKTALFESIRQARSEEFPEILARAVRQAYSEIFIIADPAKADETAIADAFRKYEPAKQRRKMVSLFLALCEASGIIQTAPKRRVRVSSSQPRSQRTSTPTPTAPVPNETVSSRNDDSLEIDLRLISSIVQQLPRNCQWTSQRRERWLDAMTSAIDLLIDIQDEPVSMDNVNSSESAQFAVNP